VLRATHNATAVGTSVVNRLPDLCPTLYVPCRYMPVLTEPDTMSPMEEMCKPRAHIHHFEDPFDLLKNALHRPKVHVPWTSAFGWHLHGVDLLAMCCLLCLGGRSFDVWEVTAVATANW